MFRQPFLSVIRSCRGNAVLFAVTFFFLLTVFMSFLIMQENRYYYYTHDAALYGEKQVFYFSSGNPQTVELIYRAIQEDGILPEIGYVTISNKEVTGFYWDGLFRADSGPPVYTPYGRFFTDEETRDGARLALLGIGYISNLDDKESIWTNGITVGADTFHVIGNMNFADFPQSDYGLERSRVHSPIVIPLNTFMNLHYIAERLRIEFSEPLSKDQRDHLDGLVKKNGGGNEYYSLPAPRNSKAAQNFMNSISMFFLLMLLALICVSNIFVYWVKRESVRYKVYLVYGATGRRIAWIISMQTVLIVSLSYICAIALTRLLVTMANIEFITALPAQLYLLTYLIVAVLTVAVSCVRAVPLIVREQMI